MTDREPASPACQILMLAGISALAVGRLLGRRHDRDETPGLDRPAETKTDD